ncbi:MAG: hypothetical protein ABIH03_02300 [Pseudomonadota bacterium]
MVQQRKGQTMCKRPTRAPCEYRGWTIEGVGGFCTVRHWWAEKGDQAFHDFRFSGLLDEIDALENGLKQFSDIHPIFRQAAYI